MLNNLKRKKCLYPLEYSNEAAKLFLGEACVILNQKILYAGNVRCSRSEDLVQHTFPKHLGYVEMSLKTAKKRIPIEMIACRPGVFEMGHKDDVSNSSWYIGNPPRSEIIKKAFYLGATEVSVELFLAVMQGKNINTMSDDRRKRLGAVKAPEITAVEGIDLELIMEFCNTLSVLSGLEPCYLKKHRPTVILFKDTSAVSAKEEKKRAAFYEDLRQAIKENLATLDIRDYDPQMTLDELHEAGVWVGHGAGSNIMKSFDSKPYYKFDIHVVDVNRFHSYLHGGKPRDIYKVYSDIKKHFKYDLYRDHINSRGWWFNPNKNGYRLPTRVEWEYAAKAGTENRWSGTDKEEEILDYANVVEGHNASSELIMKTKKPNAWGFYDMTGNAWETTWNVGKFNPNSYAVCGGGPEKIGGDWGKWRVSSMLDNSSAWSGPYNLGFRIARNI